MIDAELARAVSIALTGGPDAVAAGAADVRAGLQGAGWGSARLGAHADAVVAAGGVWPHPVPAELRSAVGSARLFAVLQEVQAELGRFGRTAAPAPAHPLTADERRLLAEVPPHHGS
ncbi:hypothetical protein [Micropruina sonneratiae]|uniref:hypothetical protein n=1 Tax=Micropruina sonneratiae TaxID=2986940 RepID=UPI0022264BF6|nr:hypothetical protein [Micropruina sp. KQZ13P-5]MCW3158906.1 hypothetical protein [Micropruina sp. KQZ13P-5]